MAEGQKPGVFFASDSSFRQRNILLFTFFHSLFLFAVSINVQPGWKSLFCGIHPIVPANAMATPTQDVTTVYQTRNILGPLTTVFTAPEECTFAGIVGDALTLAYRAQTCAGERLEDASACWPQATAAAPLNSPPYNGWGFYSPGISCPAGHTSACFATQGSHTGWDMQFAMDAGETAVGCCPT